MAFANIGGTVLHYELLGDPQADRVVVFSNALGTDFRIWLPVFDELDDDLAILLYDTRGHGLSGLGKQPSSMEDYAQDLIDLCAHLKIRKATICGLSVGGLIAQAVWKLRPQLVEGLVLCGTATRIGTAESWDDRIETVRSKGLAAISPGAFEKWFTPDFHNNRAADLEGYRLMLERQAVDGYCGLCGALRDADLGASSAKISVPVLCVAGDTDGSTPPEVVRRMAEIIPEADLEVISNCGHIICVEQPEKLARLINRFVARLDA